MNNKRIENLIPKAIKYINDNFVEDGNVKKEKQGYLASFGPTVISSGLTQTITFYQGDKNKNEVIKLMFDILKDELDTTQKLDYKNYAIKNKILDANIACKLAIRTFNLKD